MCHDEFLGPPQPLKQRQTPSGVGCRRSETLPVCPAQPESKSKTAKARSHRIDDPQGGEPTLASPSHAEPCHAAAPRSDHPGHFIGYRNQHWSAVESPGCSMLGKVRSKTKPREETNASGLELGLQGPRRAPDFSSYAKPLFAERNSAASSRRLRQ
jgi:hypothetical protein